MKKENAIKQIRENLKKLLQFAEVKMGTLVLSDGTNISLTSPDLEIGAEVKMLDDLGNQMPCDPGTYVLQDGRSFVCDEAGKITEIKEVVKQEEVEDLESPEEVMDSPETMKKKEMMAKDGMPEGQEKMQEEGVETEKETEKEVEIEVNPELAKKVADLEAKIVEILDVLSKMGDTQNELNKQMMSSIQKFGAEPGDEPVAFGKKGYKNYESKKSAKKDETFEELKTLMKKRRTKF